MWKHATSTPPASARWAWVGTGVGLVLACLTQAPAHWLAHALTQATDARLVMQDPQGTVWNGSAQWVLQESAASPGVALPTRMQWRLAPHIDWSHARVGLSATLTSACCTPEPVRVDVSPLWRGVRVQVSDHTSTWPTHWLVGLGAPWNTVQPEGQLQLQTTQLAWAQQAGEPQLHGQAELQLQELATRLSTLRPLGNYRVQLRGGASPTFTLDTLEGSLLLQGSGQWVNGRMRFQGEASSTPEAQAALSNLLNILGQRQGAKSILKMG